MSGGDDEDDKEEVGRADADDDDDGTGDGVGGELYVPLILLHPTEASSILALSSQEMSEAMHRVKILPFLVLIMLSMELLTLFSVMLDAYPPKPLAPDGHGPGDPTDTSPRLLSRVGGGHVQMRWYNRIMPI